MKRGEAGFTLIELMVSLALFGLIAVAGLTFVNGVLDTHRRTQSRLDRLADLQRAVFVIDADLKQLAPGPILEDRQGLAFRRHVAGGEQPIRYTLASGVLLRASGGRTQRLIDGIAAMRWQFYDPGQGWRGNWPPDPAQANAWPMAIACDLVGAPRTQGLGGVLRRVVILPRQP